MRHTHYVTAIAESLAPADRPEGLEDLFVALRELTQGCPVSRANLAATLRDTEISP